MTKINLLDMTIMIPFRCDSQDRLENLELVIEYLTHHFDTNIIVKEVSEQSMLGNLPWIRKVKYIYEFSSEEKFHRTKILNDMLEEVITPYVSVYDCDVLFPIQSYVDTLNALRNGEVFVFPYQGPFHEIPRRFIPEVKNRMEVNWIPLDQTGVNHPQSVGGSVFLNTEVYKKLGAENELCIDWGWEDGYRVNLYQKFGYNICRVGTILYHFEHQRGKSSGPSNPFHNHNQNEYYKTVYMSKEDLDSYISTWSRFRK